ncbi:feruloyl CoA ortho-hydroxylase 1-like [Herrania umbratica]|uniref:Feruloyl CoA ortho-hydroxylase 1-like n=1 Tax=Herrania umbratica TaxID=108875 RepID=A0A6J0ZVU3_9ROSI|nr:feruloyl CoA ortho-hydroxylase 1-like [Herrania umbratica]
MAPTPADQQFNTDSSALTDFVINQGNGVKGLSETGLKALPKAYIQPLEERMCASATQVSPQESIPIIDMSNWEEPKVAKAVCDAAEKWGFFQVVNHAVPIQVLENSKMQLIASLGCQPRKRKSIPRKHSASSNVRCTLFLSLSRPQAPTALPRSSMPRVTPQSTQFSSSVDLPPPPSRPKAPDPLPQSPTPTFVIIL